MKEGYTQNIDFGDFTKGGREQTAVKTNRDPGTADTSSLVLGQGKPLAQKAYPAPQTAENAERHGERTAQDAEKLPLAGQPQSEKRGNNPVDATTGQAAADPNQPKESPSRSAKDDPLLDYMVREVFGTYEPWHPGKRTIENKYGYEFIDTPQEKARKRAEIRAEIPQEKQERLRKILHGYNSVQGLTEDEWKVLEVESWPYLDKYFASMDETEERTVGLVRDSLNKQMDERFKKLLKDMMTDRYPDWWKVYDKDGNRIWKMSLMDKALLAKWRHFDSLPPDEKLAILREWADTHIRKEETAGEKFAKAIEFLFDFLLALFSPAVEDEENSDRPAPKPA